MTLLFAAWAHAAVVVDPPPVAGAETTITLTHGEGSPRPGVTVRVFHGPGLASEQERAVGITDAHGRASWTPERAGRTIVHTEHEQQVVHVAWSRLHGGLLTLLLALFTAAGIGIAWGRGRIG